MANQPSPDKAHVMTGMPKSLRAAGQETIKRVGDYNSLSDLLRARVVEYVTTNLPDGETLDPQLAAEWGVPTDDEVRASIRNLQELDKATRDRINNALDQDVTQ